MNYGAILVDQIATRLAAEVAAKNTRTTLLFGVSGSQGSGKSTICAALKDRLNKHSIRVALLSLDNFYLTRDARQKLAREVHPLLKTRGVPGTHDVSLVLHTLEALRNMGVVALPSFDKATDDRRPEMEWARVQAPVNVILFEGWCVGAVSEMEGALAAPVNALERDEDPKSVWRRYVNAKLAGEYQELFQSIDLLILLAAPSFDVVYRWRLQQEHALRKKVATEGGDASQIMSDQELKRFVDHYERLTLHILAEMPSRADIVLRLDEKRRGAMEVRKKPQVLRRPSPLGR